MNEPAFSVLEVQPVAHAAAPTLEFSMHVSDPLGRAIHTIALTTQVRIEPARRQYDDETRARLIELFGAPERWAATTHAFQWAQVDVLVPGFTGATSFPLRLPCSYDLELAAVKYFYSLPDGEIPLSFNFTGMVLYAGERDRLQVTQVPWSCTARWGMPVAEWRRAIRAFYPEGGWVRLTTGTLDALIAAQGAARGPRLRPDRRGRWLPRHDRGIDVSKSSSRRCCGRATRSTRTRRARLKNATPTPFGIVYPPAYAAGSPHTFDHIKMPCVVEAGADLAVSVSVRFLQASGVRHEAAARRVDAPGEFDFDGLTGRVSLVTEPLPAGLTRVTATVENTTPVPEGLTRTESLTHALLSTHVVLRVAGGRFVSPSAPSEHAATAVMTSYSVNTFPVLAADDDTVMLGAAIILPDHPQIAPESKGSLFDSTEIEEALRLHLLALSDGERAELQEHDPALREMLERAIATAPRDLVDLHGRVTVSDPAPSEEEIRGEQQARLDSGAIVRRGDHVSLRPEVGKHAQDHLLDRPHRDHRADLRRLRRPRPPVRDGGRRPRPGADARHRPVPVLQALGSGGPGDERPPCEADPRRRRRQRLAPGRRVRQRGGAAPGGPRAARRRLGDGLRDERARPRLRADPRLQRAGPARREPAGRRARDAVRDGARALGLRGRRCADGETIDPHDMNPQTVLRFVNVLGGWPGKVVVDRLRAGRGRRARARPHGRGRGAPWSRRCRSSLETVAELQTPTQAYARAVDRVGDRRHGGQHADGRPVTVVDGAHRAPAAGRSRTRCSFYFGICARETVCEGAALELEVVPARLRVRALRARVGRRGARVPLPRVRERRRGGGLRRRAGGRVDRGRGGSMHRVKVRVVEDALDANNTIARANRATSTATA